MPRRSLCVALSFPLFSRFCPGIDPFQGIDHVLIGYRCDLVHMIALIAFDGGLHAHQPQRFPIPIRCQNVNGRIAAGGDLRFSGQIIAGYLQIQQDGIVGAVFLAAAVEITQGIGHHGALLFIKHHLLHIVGMGTHDGIHTHRLH